MPPAQHHDVVSPLHNSFGQLGSVQAPKRQLRLGGDVGQKFVGVAVQQRNVPVELHIKPRRGLVFGTGFVTVQNLHLDIAPPGQCPIPRRVILNRMSVEDAHPRRLRFPARHPPLSGRVHRYHNDVYFEATESAANTGVVDVPRHSAMTSFRIWPIPACGTKPIRLRILPISGTLRPMSSNPPRMPRRRARTRSLTRAGECHDPSASCVDRHSSVVPMLKISPAASGCCISRSSDFTASRT